MSVLRLLGLSGGEDRFVFSEDGWWAVERLLLLVSLLVQFGENLIIRVSLHAVAGDIREPVDI